MRNQRYKTRAMIEADRRKHQRKLKMAAMIDYMFFSLIATIAVCAVL